MTNKEARIRIQNFIFLHRLAEYSSATKLVEALKEGIKALEVVEKIKKAYLANKEIEEIDDAMCFANATYNILCEAYGSDIDCESWKMRLNKEDNPNV